MASKYTSLFSQEDFAGGEKKKTVSEDFDLEGSARLKTTPACHPPQPIYHSWWRVLQRCSRRDLNLDDIPEEPPFPSEGKVLFYHSKYMYIGLDLAAASRSATWLMSVETFNWHQVHMHKPGSPTGVSMLVVVIVQKEENLFGYLSFKEFWLFILFKKKKKSHSKF